MMSEMQQKIPTLNPLFRLQWEPAQESHVLLYPEGMVQLNGPASEILTRIDGVHSVAQIVDQLQQNFPEAEDLANDVEAFLVDAHEQNWISL
jgi:pyrroloquinoline quinone biosynthesis protein D